MKTMPLLLLALLGGSPAYPAGPGISLESVPPVVVKTIPVAGSTNVDPALTELRITYSKPMSDRTWGWFNYENLSYPQTLSDPKSSANKRTFTRKVKLEPGKFYGIWLNHDSSSTGIVDTNGIPAVPYLLTFKTAKAISSSPPSDLQFVRVVLDGGQMTFENQPTGWEQLDNLLKRVPDRAHTVLEYAVASDSVTLQQQNEWSAKLSLLAGRYGFKYLSYVGVHPFASKGAEPPRAPSDVAARAPSATPDANAIVQAAVTTISRCAEGDPRVETALKSLRSLHQEDVISALIPHLDSTADTVRRSAVYIFWKAELTDLGPAVPPLEKLLAHNEDLTRGMAALALGQNRVLNSFEGLAKMTKDDPSGYARRCAAYALGLLGDSRARPILEAALQDPEAMVRSNAQRALDLLGKNPAKTSSPRGPREIIAEKIEMAVGRKLKEAGAKFDDLRATVAVNRDSGTPFKVIYRGLRDFKSADGTVLNLPDGDFLMEYIGGGQWQGQLAEVKFTVPVGRVDNIDLPFVNDPPVLGEWEAVDMVRDPSEFNPGKRTSPGALFLKGMSFLDNGKLPQPWLTWTKGVVMHQGDKTASHYEIQNREGREYLFFEWKSGDVTIAGQKPHYYVLRKKAATD